MKSVRLKAFLSARICFNPYLIFDKSNPAKAISYKQTPQLVTSNTTGLVQQVGLIAAARN